MFLQENNLRSVVLANIAQNNDICTMQKMLAHISQSSECFPNTAETTWHKKITGEMLAQSAPDLLLQENWLFEMCLVALFLTRYNITKQSWLFFSMLARDFIYSLQENNEQRPTFTGTVLQNQSLAFISYQIMNENELILMKYMLLL